MAAPPVSLPIRAARRRAAETPHTHAADLQEARGEALHCRACPLWKQATQTVFGEGAPRAAVMLVGEQPGDQEDHAGHPFIGPAGQLLDRALRAAGVERARTYVTNAVKHFKFELRGKRRLHKKPSDAEIDVCSRWLIEEITLVRPRLIVAMGVSAARGIFGRATVINRNRGKLLEYAGTIDAQVLVTVHPSFLLRVPESDKAREFEHFVSDLKLARPFLMR